MKRIFGGMNNPWNAFQSAFAEPPFDIYDTTRGQVSMFYHTMKDHLVRHVGVFTDRPTGSLWDYIPEPRPHAAQPLINNEVNPGIVDPINEVRGEAEAHPRPQEVQEKKDKTKEEEILQREKEEARPQRVDQMTNLSEVAMPLGHKITSILVALVSVGLAVGPFWSPATADVPVPLLQ